jgi:hypothetical protein
VQTLDSEHPSIASIYLTAAGRQTLGKSLPKAAIFIRQAANDNVQKRHHIMLGRHGGVFAGQDSLGTFCAESRRSDVNLTTQ